MDIVDQIVERRIAEAVERGEFEDLPGAGQPLELEDDPLVPAELRVAYRLLKNAGYVPDEVRLFAELRSAEQLLTQASAEEERVVATARLRVLLERMGAGRAMAMQVQSQYFEQLDGTPPVDLHQMVMQQVERPLYETVMDYAGGNQSRAAAMLGISRSTLRKKLAQYEIE